MSMVFIYEIGKIRQLDYTSHLGQCSVHAQFMPRASAQAELGYFVKNVCVFC